MANAIHQCNGGDQYATSGGRHCNVRRMYLPTYKLNDDGDPFGDPIGVELVELPVGEEQDVPQLKYPVPIVDVSPESLASNLTTAELEFFVNNMDMDNDEWDAIGAAALIKSQQEE